MTRASPPEAYTEDPDGGVDFIVRGEGEITFREPLRALEAQRGYDHIAALSHRSADGRTRGSVVMGILASSSSKRSGSQETRCWRRESRANSSLKPKFPASWESTGNFAPAGIPKGGSDRESYKLLQQLRNEFPAPQNRGSPPLIRF
jgi:hypothetical protein